MKKVLASAEARRRSWRLPIFLNRSLTVKQRDTPPRRFKVPKGWKLVPLEPTLGMWDHAENVSMQWDMQASGKGSDKFLRESGAFDFPTMRIAALVHVYREMVKVAPTPADHAKVMKRIEAVDDIPF